MNKAPENIFPKISNRTLAATLVEVMIGNLLPQ